MRAAFKAITPGNLINKKGLHKIKKAVGFLLPTA